MNDNVVAFPGPHDTSEQSSPTTEQATPDFITRMDIMKMSDEDLDKLLEAIRIRRMISHAKYSQTMAEKEAIAEERARVRLEKKADQILRKINVINKHDEDLEKYINELRGLRLQAGLSAD